MAIYEHLGVRPTLGPRVFVAPNATLIGDVTLRRVDSVVLHRFLLQSDEYTPKGGRPATIDE